jgi:ectoine hydroxylase-related dioxygenase (phytanoyl-CoA dioxygenase family)
MIIWNGLTVHATFPNTSDQMRIVQYIRLMPALPECEQRDNHAPKLMAKEDADVRRALQSVQLSEIGRRLLGLEQWD